MLNPSCARCPQASLHGLNASRHIYTSVMPSSSHNEGVIDFALTCTRNCTPKRQCISPPSSLFSPWDTAPTRESPRSSMMQSRARRGMKDDANKRYQLAQSNTNRPKPIVRDGNSNTHTPQGARHKLLLPGVRLQQPRQLRRNLRGGGWKVQPLLRGKFYARLTTQLNSEERG